jgi:hypothetical protein
MLCAVSSRQYLGQYNVASGGLCVDFGYRQLLFVYNCVE